MLALWLSVGILIIVLTVFMSRRSFWIPTGEVISMIVKDHTHLQDRDDIIKSFASGQLTQDDFETLILNNSDWDGNKPADQYYILWQAYRDAWTRGKRS